MNSREDRRRALDEAAELYNRFRPGYPSQLVDDVLALSGISPRGRILEIGCGTGQATIGFAQRGYDITCLEPGPNLAKIARKKLLPYPNVRIESSTFEEWHCPDSTMDLVIAAQSLHLVDPAVALIKAARVLRPGGALAVFWNSPLRGDSAVEDRIQQAYVRHAPSLAEDGSKAPPLEDAIDNCGRYGTVFMARYRWQKTFSAEEYVRLMETQSPHRLLPVDSRMALLAEIRAAIEEAGGELVVMYVANLRLARRLAGK